MFFCIFPIFMKPLILCAVSSLLFISCGNTQNTTLPPSSQSGAAVETARGSTSKSFTAEVVASHNTSSDCWAIIDKNVYDLTPWIALHPGGKGPILQSCGKDISAESSSHKGGSFSDPRIRNILKKYHKGSLEE